MTPQTAQLDAVAGVAPTGVTFMIANPSTKGHGFAVACDSEANPSPEEGYLAPSASASVALELLAPLPGTSTVTCTVTSRSGHTAYAKFVLTLRATGTGADFSVAVKPAALTLEPGKSGTSQVVIGRIGGFLSHVALAVSGVPAGATAIFAGSGGGDDELQAGRDGQGDGASLLVNAGTAKPGSYTLMIDATSGALAHHAPIALTVGGTPPVAKPDFAVAASPGSLSVTAGGAAAPSSISVIPANGFASPVTLTLAGMPAGATGSFDKAIMAGGIGSATLTVQAMTAAAGKYPLTVTAAGGGLTHNATVELTIASGAPAADFTLAATPGALNLTDGGAAATTTVRVTPSNGFVRDVSLTVSGAPVGVKASLSTSTIYAGSGTATLSVQATTAAAGSFTLTITAAGGTSTHTASVALAVAAAAPAPDFAVAASPGALSVTVGGAAATSSISVIPANGFTSPVTLALAGLPAGATGNFDKTTLAGGSGSAILAVQAKTAAAGKYLLTVTAAGGGLTHSATVDLTIATAAPAADFTLAATPGALNLTDGGAAATTTVRVTPSNGFVRDVSLTVSGAPAGATATFNTSTIYAGSGTATLSVQAMNAAAGSFTLTITATGGTSTHTASVALAVAAAAPPPDFAVSASPTSLQLTAPASGTSLIRVSPMNGFAASVTLSVAGLPAGATASFTTPTLATGSGTDTLTVSSGTAGAGTYPLTVTATGGGVSHTAAIGLTIAAPAACTQDTWGNFAQAFMVNNCVSCHSFASSVATLKQHSNASYISNGSMPPGGALSASDKSRILQWLSCGLP